MPEAARIGFASPNLWGLLVAKYNSRLCVGFKKPPENNIRSRCFKVILMPEEKKETGGIKEIKDAKKNGNQNPAQSPSPPQTPPQPEKSEEERKKDERMAALIKEIEQAFFAFRFYPVATKEDSRIQAENRIIDTYAKEDDTVKQMILYMIHENLSQAADMKTMHNFEHFKRKLPTADPSQIRINVYRAMFNYNFSL